LQQRIPEQRRQPQVGRGQRPRGPRRDGGLRRRAARRGRYAPLPDR
jgi:hypothetical protein